MHMEGWRQHCFAGRQPIPCEGVNVTFCTCPQPGIVGSGAVLMSREGLKSGRAGSA